MAGAAAGEPVLYVTLSETEEELRSVAESHGWQLDGVTVRELMPPEAALEPDDQTTMFHPSEVELAATTKLIVADVERRVVKYRGVKFRGRYHDYVINPGGVQVYQRLVAAEHRQPIGRARLPSDIAELDALLGGGIEEGTSTRIVGAAGTGKSTLGAQFAAAAAASCCRRRTRAAARRATR